MLYTVVLLATVASAVATTDRFSHCLSARAATWDNATALLECGEAVVGANPHSKCALKCTAEALAVYWACAAACVEKDAPNACILDGCPAAVAAFDVPCLKGCTDNATTAVAEAKPATAGGEPCPPLSVQSNFNITEYLRATWYVQRQQKNGYQPASSLFCVVATYNSTYHGAQAKVPFFGGEVFSVFNDCRKGSKDADVCNNFTSPDFKPSFAIPLCGRVPDMSEPARITVAPCLLPNFLSGDYWVAAAGPTPARYEYALVIAGQPSVRRSDGCTVPDTCSNPAEFSCGMWFFTRDPTPQPEVMAMLAAAAKEKGISTQLLLDVDQRGCSYEGMQIKH